MWIVGKWINWCSHSMSKNLTKNPNKKKISKQETFLNKLTTCTSFKSYSLDLDWRWISLDKTTKKQVESKIAKADAAMVWYFHLRLKQQMWNSESRLEYLFQIYSKIIYKKVNLTNKLIKRAVVMSSLQKIHNNNQFWGRSGRVSKISWSFIILDRSWKLLSMHK